MPFHYITVRYIWTNMGCASDDQNLNHLVGMLKRFAVLLNNYNVARKTSVLSVVLKIMVAKLYYFLKLMLSCKVIYNAIGCKLLECTTFTYV